VTNEGATERTIALDLDLYAAVAHSETGWGWLYDVPWSHGNYHDFFALERIRRTTEGGGYLLGTGVRRLRLGRPRVPGIQRDEDPQAMLMAHELPHHVSPDERETRLDAVHAVVRGLSCRSGDGSVLLAEAGEIELRPGTEQVLPGFELRPGTVIELELRCLAPDQTGVVFTHGNHPDSLQLGLDRGRPWFGVAGEREEAGEALAAGRWYRLRLRAGGSRVVLGLDGHTIAATAHWSRSRRWTARVSPDGTVTIADRDSPGVAAYAFQAMPDVLDSNGCGAHARWMLRLSPGQTAHLGVVCGYGRDAAAVQTAAVAAAAAFTSTMDGTKDGMRRLWRSMFIPGNPDFSGHLPTLHTSDRELARAYYMGALVPLYLRNLHAAPDGPVFLTGGPRLGPTTTFYWDHAEWSRMYAMLEPRGMRAWLLRVLSGPYEDFFGIDTRHGGGLGNVYAANHHALFKLVEHYVCVTGDTAFLDETAGTATVLAHLHRLAYGWAGRRSAATGGVLADFGGDSWRLLECVPNYVHVVASFNAAYVGMMRSLAALLHRLGRYADAEVARQEATELAVAVLDLYVHGGRWQTRHPAGPQTIGHVLDFGLVAANLHGDLDPRQREDMVAFVVEHLLAGDWMRALSADDPVAAESDRPDHGAGGAFCAWPGMTAYGLARLGRHDLALRVLRGTPRAASAALWGQAMEVLDPDASGAVRARVAERGISNRDSVGAAAVAEAVLSALFGLEPSFATLGDPVPPRPPLSGVGTLHHLNLANATVPAPRPR
jgi:hypothetical protein